MSTIAPHSLRRTTQESDTDSPIYSPIVRRKSHSSSESSRDSITSEFNKTPPLTSRIQEVFKKGVYVSDSCLSKRPEIISSYIKNFSPSSEKNSDFSVRQEVPCTTYILWRNPHNVPIKIAFDDDDTEPVTHTHENQILGIKGLPNQTISFTCRDTLYPIPPTTLELRECKGKEIRIKVAAGNQPVITLIPRSSSPSFWLRV